MDFCSILHGLQIAEYSDKLRELYNAIFVKEYTFTDHKRQLGKYCFNKDSKRIILEADTLLGRYASYE